MDILHSVLKWVDYNRGLVISLVLGLIAATWMVGCDVKTGSLLDPARQVTGAQLDREITTLQEQLDKRSAAIKAQEAEYNADVIAANANITAANADLEAQAQLRLKLIEMAGGIGSAVASGGFTAPAAIGSVVQLLTLLTTGGLLYDNRRKDRVITARTPVTPTS